MHQSSWSRVVGATSLVICIAGCNPASPVTSTTVANEEAVPAVVPVPDGVGMAPAEHRSERFEPVAKHLHLGGDLYLFMSFEDLFGDVERQILDLAAADEDALKIARGALSAWHRLGMDQFRAVGVSSYRDADMYENRMMLHTSGQSGILDIYGSEPRPFLALERAPADTMFALELELRIKDEYDLILEVVKEIDADTAAEIDANLDTPIPQTQLTLRDLLAVANTRLAFGLRLDASAPLQIPGESVTVPRPSAVLGLDGVGTIVQQLIDGPGAGSFTAETQGETRLYVSAMPIPGLETAMAIAIEPDGRTWLATSKDALLPWLEATDDRLATSEVFTGLTANLPKEGTSLVYVSPALTQLVNAEIERQVGGLEQEFAPVLAKLLAFRAGGLAQVVTVVPEGRLVASRSPLSYRAMPMASWWMLSVGLAVAATTAGDSLDDLVRGWSSGI